MRSHEALARETWLGCGAFPLLDKRRPAERCLTRRAAAVLLESMSAPRLHPVRAPRLWGATLGLCLLSGVSAVAAAAPKAAPEKSTVAAGAPAKAGAAATTQVAPAPIAVQPFSSPASLPALGVELAQALVGVLTEAGIPAVLGKGDESGGLSGRVWEVGDDRIRLSVSGRGGNARKKAKEDDDAEMDHVEAASSVRAAARELVRASHRPLCPLAG